nr:ermin-like [Nerophis lumbriciformis]
MEMQESPMFSNPADHEGEEEVVMASQVLEIICGFAPESKLCNSEPEERDIWSVEEGDDSVFYSDEDLAGERREANGSHDSAFHCSLKGKQERPQLSQTSEEDPLSEEKNGQAPPFETPDEESDPSQPSSGSESDKDGAVGHLDVLPLDPVPGYSTLPLPKKSSDTLGDQESFNHLTPTKYSSVSYRKIRRGNTRKKIEEFEYIMMNL